MYRHASSSCLSLLDGLLVFDPSMRLTVDDALEHPYLATWHQFGETKCDYTFDASFEGENEIEGMKVSRGGRRTGSGEAVASRMLTSKLSRRFCVNDAGSH